MAQIKLTRKNSKVCAGWVDKDGEHHCGFRKHLSHFGRDRSAEDGRQKRCSQCCREYRNANKGRIRGSRVLDEL